MKLLALRLAALLSFLGGPMFLSDLLRAPLGQLAAFVVAFAPVGLLVFGGLAFRDDPSETMTRVSLRSGLVGAALLTAENAFAAFAMSTGERHANERMITFGIVVGTLAAGFYVRQALRLLRRRLPPVERR